MSLERPSGARYEKVALAAALECAFCTQPQHRVPIYAVRKPRDDIASAWEGLTFYW